MNFLAMGTLASALTIFCPVQFAVVAGILPATAPSATQPSSSTVQHPALQGQEVRTTESLRAEVLGNDEDAADAWAQLNAFIPHARWSDAAEAAENLLTHMPTVLIRQARDASLFWPARRVVGDLLTKHREMLDAYRSRYDLDAQALMAGFEHDERLPSLEQMVARFPFASLCGQALRQLADGRLDRADFVRAAAAFAQLQATEKSSTNSAEMATWACKEASALLGAGFIARAAEKVVEIRRAFGQITLERSGSPLKVGEFCDRLEKEIAARRRPPETPLAIDRLRSAASWSFGFNIPAPEAAFRRKYPAHMPLFEPSAFDGIAYATDGNELRAVEIAGGREKWDWRPERPDRYNVEGTQRWLEQLAPTSLRPAVTDRYVLFLRPIELAETVHSVCCLDRQTGRLLWQRVAWSDEQESAETAPVVVGDRGFVIVSSLKRLRPDRMAVESRAVVCFRLDTAERLWRSPLPPPAPPAANDTPGSVAGPFICAMSVLAFEDRGLLYGLDYATGDIQWARSIVGPESEPNARPGGGLCAGAGGRVCVVRAGSPQVECYDSQSGQRLWSQNAGAIVRWLATDGARVLVAAKEMRAFALADGAPAWHGEAAEPPIGPGCLAGDLVLVPTANALHIYEARTGRLAGRLVWPEKQPMTHLVASQDEVVGLMDDTVCKLGKPGLTPVVLAPPPPAAKPSPPAPKPAAEQPSADEIAAQRWFPGVHMNPGVSLRETFSRIGRPLTDSPSDWIAYDASARQLRRTSPGRLPTLRWQIGLEGNIRSIEFDEGFIYILGDDRVEIRRMNDGAEMFKRQGPAIRQPLFGQGKALWAYERGQGEAKTIHLAGVMARLRRELDVAISEFGLQDLCAYCWEGERLSLLGDKPGGGRVFVTGRIRGPGLAADLRSFPADEVVRSVDFNRTAWTVIDNRLLFVGPERASIYAYSVYDGKRLWKCSLEGENKKRLPLVFLGRSGRYLLWSQVAPVATEARRIGIFDLQSASNVATIEGHHAFFFRGRVYSLNGRALCAHEIQNGRVIKAIQYPRRPDQPVWAQPFANSFVVAMASESGPIRQVLLQSPDLTEAVTRVRGDQSSRQIDIPIHREPIQIDGSLGDWDGVRMEWQEISTWRPVLDRNGKPLVGQRPPGFSARWRACIKDNALYLVAAVRDGRIVTNRWSDCPWIGDSIEVALRGERFARNMPTLTLSLDGPGQCWAAGPRLPADQVCVRYDPLEREIVYEMAFPFSWLNKAGILAGRGQRGRAELAFDLAVNDNDGAGLLGSLEWGEGLADSWNPSEWMTLRLDTGER